MKKIKFLFFLPVIFLSIANAEPEGSFSLECVSKYLWRGQVLSSDLSVQPDFVLSYKNFSLDLWANMNVVKNKIEELDTTISYSFFFSKLGVSYGLIYYTFPYSINLSSISSEVFAELNYDLFLSPKITGYYDFAAGDGVYLEASLEYNAKLFVDFSIGISLGYNFGQWNYNSSLTVLGIPVSVGYSLKDLNISSGGFLQISLDNQYQNYSYFSFGLSYNF